jgi:hypothetical protein
LNKLLQVTSEGGWNHAPVDALRNFLQMLLSIEDGLQRERFHDVLLHPKYGFAVIVQHEL